MLDGIRVNGAESTSRKIIDAVTAQLYIVHMKRVTASEARKNWFRLLDEAAAGEVIVIDRKGKRLVLRKEKADRKKPGLPNYRDLLEVLQADNADAWRWEWAPEGLIPVDQRK